MRFRLSAPTTCALPAWPALAGSIAPAISTPWISSSGATRTASLDHLYSQTLTFAFKLQTHKSWKLLASVTLYDQTQGFIGFARYHLSLVLFEIAPERPMRDLKAVAEMSPNDTPELFTDHPGCWSTFIPPYLEPFWSSLEHHCWLPLEALWHVPNCHALVLHLQWNVHLASSWKSACSTPPFQNPAQEGVQAKNWSSHFGRDDNFSLSTTEPFVKAESVISTSVMLSIGIFLRCASNVPFRQLATLHYQAHWKNWDVGSWIGFWIKKYHFQHCIIWKFFSNRSHSQLETHALMIKIVIMHEMRTTAKEQLSNRKHASWGVFNDSSNLCCDDCAACWFACWLVMFVQAHAHECQMQNLLKKGNRLQMSEIDIFKAFHKGSIWLL